MDQPVVKQAHHPYRRGERKRTPFKTEQTAPPTQEDAHFQQPSSSTVARGVVLLVEPEASLRWQLGKTLTERGYCVVEAASATQARAWLAQKTFELLLLDVDLPDDAGWALLRMLATSLPLAPPLLLLPKRQRPLEQVDTAPPGSELQDLPWVADLVRLVEGIRSAPGPPGHADAEAESSRPAGW